VDYKVWRTCEPRFAGLILFAIFRQNPELPDERTTMIPPAFVYLRPKTIPEAIGFLQQYGDEAKILSGGQSLIPMMKFRLAQTRLSGRY
jgi:hypothetical protein